MLKIRLLRNAVTVSFAAIKLVISVTSESDVHPRSVSAELAEAVPIAVKLRVTSVASRDTLTRILQFVVQKLKW